MFAFNSPTDRMMARVAIGIFTCGLLFGLYSVGPPLYWRFYATVIHPFEDPSLDMPKEDPFADMLKEDPTPDPKLTTGPQGQDPKRDPQPAVVQTAQQQPAKTGYDPSKPYALTKELIDSLAQDGYIMVTWANEHYLDFALTWVANLKRVGVTGYLVGAMDDDMLKALADRGINTWRMNTGITKHDLGWGSPNFHKMGRFKISMIKTVLETTSKTVVISDIDTAWVRNPIPFFNKYPEADILTSSDQLRPTVQTEDLERWPDAGAAFNIGIMVFKPNSKAFVDEWIKMLDKPDVWDQNAFNDLVRVGAERSNDKGLFKGYKGQLTVGILPVSLFASGQVFFVQRKYNEFGLKPFVAHATFQYSGTPGKRHRFREFMLFEDPPEYYDHSKGFISLRVNIPKELLDKADGKLSRGEMTADKLANHFNLVHHQMLYIRAGVALAMLTGRALILPPIWCELDKYWAPLFDGNIPGSQWKKPYICPMDHVLDIEAGWFPKKPEDAFGPHVEWREYSFLQNPRLTPAVNNSRVVIEVCPGPDAGCSDGATPAPVQNGVIKLAPGRNGQQLETALKSASQFKIWDITDAVRMWPKFEEQHTPTGWFVTKQKHDQFVTRLKHMTSVSCCLNKQPGWVWYDFLWDVPHKDRHHRQFDSWHVKLGDQDIKGRLRSRALLGHSLNDMPEFLASMEADGMSRQEG